MIGLMSTTRRQLLAVMFTDIVGYSAMVNRDERRAQELLEMQRRAVRSQVFRHEGRVVEIIGDGHLVTFNNARAAIECATALQLQFLRRNAAEPPERQLRLRIGIHVGDIERGPKRVFGDGVNVAARLEPLAPRGGVMASAEAVAQLHGPLRACFASQGFKELKNIAEPHEVFALQESGLEAAVAHVPAPNALRIVARKYGRAAMAGIAVLALTGAGVFAWHSGAFESGEDASIAVLPLENLSSDAGSADFVAGLHDSLLTEVGTMPQLKVISRTSVMRYAHNPPPVPEIARALKVGYILEGSVQRSARRVRINVQLIRARTDQHIWAKTYDRDAADLFDVQSQIAREIARSTQGRVALDAAPASKRPTTSVDAYDYYLRAIALEDNDPKLGREPATAQIALLEQAVALDPNFALAWAALARYSIWSANWAAYSDPARYESFLQAADTSALKAKAIALAPRLPESLLADGLVAYWKGEDKARVAEYFEEALAARPGYPAALFWVAGVYDRMGQQDKSAAALQALKSIDPYNERVYTLLAQQLLNRRQYPALARTYLEWRAISETPDFVDFWASEVPFLAEGDLAPRKALLARDGLKGVTQDDLDNARWQLAMYERRFGDAARVFRAGADAFMAGRAEDFMPALQTGVALGAGGDAPAARPYLERARDHLREMNRRMPGNGFTLGQLAAAARALDDGPAGLQHAKEAVDATEPKPGTPPGPGYYHAVLTYANALGRFGHKAESLDRLGWLLQQPSDVHAHAVLADPEWLPMNQDADFRALLVPPKN